MDELKAPGKPFGISKHVPLEYSIVSLTCAVTSRHDAVVVGLPRCCS